MFKSVLFVCIGNICRSPVAEGMLKHYSERYGLGLKVESCGVHAMVGQHPQPYSIEVAAAHSIDVSMYQARQITHDMLASADLVFALDHLVLDRIVQRFPFAVGKVKKLGFLENDRDIEDPYRKNKDAFVEMYKNMDLCLRSCLKKLWDVAIF
jgi:protein-tyrosine phosphatase